MVIQTEIAFVNLIMNALTDISPSQLGKDRFKNDEALAKRKNAKTSTLRLVSGKVDDKDRAVPEKSPADWSLVLQSVGQGQDRIAFAELFGHFGPRVKSLMLKYGAPNELAEEIVQESFAIVWRKASQFDADKAAASTWIFTIARNKRIDILRRQNRPEPDMNDPAMTPDPFPNSEELMSGKQRALAVQRALAKLPEAQREVLHRSYFSEETHSEIAESLKTPLGTVKSRLRLALAKLRTLIDEDMEEGSL